MIEQVRAHMIGLYFAILDKVEQTNEDKTMIDGEEES
jgi:hypothetical protein